MRSKFFNKKFIVLFFIILILSSTLPKLAFAYTALPVVEVNPLMALIEPYKSIITAVSSAGNFAERLYEWAFKIAGEALKRKLLNMIVDQIVVWIQGGGDPKFITDWPGFLKDAVDQAGGDFIQRLRLSQLCSAFGPRLSAGFIPIPKFSDRSACTLSQVGANLDNFLNDFRQGGWVAWQEMILKPQNNIYGAYLMAWDQYEIEQSAAAKAAQSEAQAGQGFLGVKRCLDPIFDADGKSIGCAKSEIITPGKAVGDLASEAIGSDIPYLMTAKDFGTYVAAITNALLNRMFAEGVGLLHSATSGTTQASLLSGECNDGIDNDRDGLVDYPADPGCMFPTDTDETDNVSVECSDYIDNDNDGLTDYPEDLGCTSPLDRSEQDPPNTIVTADLKINGFDYSVGIERGDSISVTWDSQNADSCSINGTDVGASGLYTLSPLLTTTYSLLCSGPTGDATDIITVFVGNTTASSGIVQCNDGIDNDGDGLIDFPNDPDCLFPTDTNEASGVLQQPECNDGVDNDGDGLIDFPADPGCVSLFDRTEGTDNGSGGGGGGGGKSGSHFACKNNTCVIEQGDGDDQCSSYGASCTPPATHLECRSLGCYKVLGPGPDNCPSTCGKTLFQNICRNQQCMQVPGSGPDQCNPIGSSC